MKGPEIINMYVGQSEENIREGIITPLVFSILFGLSLSHHDNLIPTSHLIIALNTRLLPYKAQGIHILSIIVLYGADIGDILNPFTMCPSSSSCLSSSC